MGIFKERMERELEIRGLSKNTKKIYLKCMKDLIKYFMNPPDQITLEDIKNYQLYMIKEHPTSWTYFNQHVSAIKFFYKHVMKRNWDIEQVPFLKGYKKLPVVISKEEVVKMYQALENPKHRTIIATLYSTGIGKTIVIIVK